MYSYLYSYSSTSTRTRTHVRIKYLDSDSDSQILQVLGLVLVLVNLVLAPALNTNSLIFVFLYLFSWYVKYACFLSENVWILITISLKFVPKGPNINIPALIQIMAWRRPGNKPLSEPMMVRLPTHICVTQPRWVNRPGDASMQQRNGL